MREDAASKGARYVATGRLVVRAVDEASGTVHADCRGDGQVYRLGYDRGSSWHCDCPAVGRCSHEYALGLVVDVASPRVR
jgi:hypothetical protein